jgi:putative ABC transport system permease protein
MACLPLANILHHKLRSILSALGIGIGICMLITLSGLARGSLREIADRWEAVDADLIVFPEKWKKDIAMIRGAGIPDGYARVLGERFAGRVRRAVPAFLWPMEVAGQDHLVAGVAPEDFPILSGGRRIDGHIFRPRITWEKLKSLLTEAKGERAEKDLLAETGWLEIVIDSRLAEAGGLRPGDTVFAADHNWTVVGVVPAGGMSRVYMHRRTAQLLFGSGARSTVMFVKLADGVAPGPVAGAIRETLDKQDAVPLAAYRDMLEARFGIMFVYVDAVNLIALVIAFLFIMVTLYTIVLQRTRDIAILKSSGASRGFLLRQVLAESMILTAAGAGAGIAMSFLARWLIRAVMPLLTVAITGEWIAVALAAAVIGALLSGLYPAWRATRVDMLEALTLE